MGNENIYNNFLKTKSKFKDIDKNLLLIKNMENNNNENKICLEQFEKKIDSLEKSLNDNINEMNSLQRESLEMINNKINNKNEYNENKYNELINEENNNNNEIILQINNLKLKEENNIKYLENKLSEFKNKQLDINRENQQKINNLNKRIMEQLNELGNIKNSIRNEEDDELIDRKINDLDFKIKQMEEYAKKVDLLIDKDKQEANKKFEEIYESFGNIKNQLEDKLQQTKKYVDDNFDNFSKSICSNINMRGENKFNNNSSINYNDKTE